MSISRLNKGSKFTIDTTDFPFKDLSELELGKPYTLRGVYVLKKRGKMKQDMPNAIIDGTVINLPAHLLDDVKEIIADDSIVADIEAGKAGFTVYTYNDDNGEHRSVKWIDLV